jgi:hypothetical protein
MTQNWRIPVDFEGRWNELVKRVMRLERRPAVTNASQLLGPGAAPYAVLLNDWNDEAATFNGIFYTEPEAANSPDDTMYWIGETFGIEDGYGFQRVTRFRVVPDAGGDWDQYRRRFYPQGDLYGYSDWEAV